MDRHNRISPTGHKLYRELERVQTRIVLGGKPLELFDEYLQYWSANGGPALVAEMSRMV